MPTRARLPRSLRLLGAVCFLGACTPPAHDLASAGFAEMIYEDPGDSQVINDVAAADWDLDGRVDVVTVGDEGVELYQPVGGSFAVAWIGQVSGVARAVSWVDIAGDARLELVVGDSNGTLHRFDPGPDGYGDPVELVQNIRGAEVGDLAWADWDGDGHLDVAVGTVDGAYLYVGDADGGLTDTGWDEHDDDHVRAVAWGHANSDSAPDLALAFEDGVVGYVQIAMGQFEVDPSIDTTGDYSAATGVAWGDCDGDGEHELAASYAQGTVFPADCVDATAVAPGSGALAWLDYDGDGWLDLATGTSLGAQVWPFLEAGATGIPVQVADETPRALVATAFSAGQHAGLVLAGNSSTELQLHSGAAPVLRPAWVGDLNSASRDVASGDLDRDGFADFVFSTSDGPVVAHGGPDGLTLSAWRSAEAEPSYSLAIGDVNGDGWLDVASGAHEIEAQPAGLSVWFGGPSGLSASADLGFAFGVHIKGVAIGDLNGDGAQDLVASTWTPHGAGPGEGYVLLNLGEGNFAAPIGVPELAGEAYAVALGDVDADGDLDIAVAKAGDDVARVLRNDGDGVFVPLWSSPEGAANSTHVAFADFDGDGWIDLAVASNHDEHPTRIWPGDGSGSLASTPLWVEPEDGGGYGQTRTVEPIDLDADGHLDFVLANEGDRDALYRANGLGGYTRVYLDWEDPPWGDEGDGEDGEDAEGPPSGPPSRSAATGDFDGDGDLDLVFTSVRSGGSSDPAFARLYENHLQGAAGLPNDPPTMRVSIDGVAATSPAAWSTLASEIVAIDVELTDLQGDPVAALGVEYSLTGSAPWFEATPVAPDPGPFEASPYGSSHRLRWAAAADGVLGPHIAVRVTATGLAARQFGEPARRASVVALSPAFHLLEDACTQVDEDGDGANACPGSDCDDGDPDVHPGASDFACDGIDSDCASGDAGDEDSDTDGFGACTDCDDLDATSFPGAEDAVCDGIDSDCDGVDEGAVDLDGDGVTACEDCDDGDPMAAVVADEVCEDGLDGDCDGVQDADEAICWTAGGCACSTTEPTSAGLAWILVLLGVLRRRTFAGCARSPSLP